MDVSHLEVRVQDRRLPIIAGRELQSVSFTSDFLTVYVQPGSSAERYLHAEAYGAVDGTATLLVDGRPVATGFVAGDMNVDDPLSRPMRPTGHGPLGTIRACTCIRVDTEYTLPKFGQADAAVMC
jgi:hypothetical protein